MYKYIYYWNVSWKSIIRSGERPSTSPALHLRFTWELLEQYIFDMYSIYIALLCNYLSASKESS